MHDRVIDGLRQGFVIALPTETVYGLSCDPRNEGAVQKIFTLKERDSNKTMLLIASSIGQVMSIADMSAAERDIAKRYWPGALTMILKCRKDVVFSSGIVKNGEIAVRVTSSKIAQEIIDACGWPLVSTSANKSGGEPAKSVEDIRMIFGDQLDFIVDGGTLPSSAPSTIIRVREDQSIEIIRQGAIHFS